MKGLLRFLSVFVFIGIFASNAWADKPKILQLKDLEPGTKAIGFSVFKGVEPQLFDVVLGETIDYLGNSLILSRVSGGPMDTLLEEIGAISGMSGSPVFIGDCKDLVECITKAPLEGNDVFLVGSTSYGPGVFIKGGPNFLLTPAEYMLGARSSGYEAASHFSNGLPNKISVRGQDFYNLMLFPKMENLPLAGNSGGRCKESVKSDIKPGSMVTFFLARGTINMGVSGTVTWRDDKKIYIFGHPFNGTGMVQYPFVQVSVADTLQTPFNAFKLPGCHLDTSGTMLIDGAFEMAGVIGVDPPMLPYQVELRMGNGGAILSEEIAASPFVPFIMKQLPALWAQQLLGDISHFSLAYQMRISIADQPEIFARNIIPVPTRQTSKNPVETKNIETKNSFEEVFDRVYAPFQAMKESGFKYRVEGVKVSLNIIKDFGLWTVKQSFLSQKKANPGETVFANIVLEELSDSSTKQISIPIQVPNDFIERTKDSGVPPQITLLVQSGNKFTDKKEVAKATSLADLIGQLNQSMSYKTNVLYVQKVMPKSKAEQEADTASAKASVKPAWKWADIDEGDLKQLPLNNENDVILTLSSPLDGFVDLNLTFNLQVEAKKDTASEDTKETKKRKWFRIF